MEEEHRRILRDALQGPQGVSFKDYLLAMPDAGEDLLFERDRTLAGRATGQALFEGHA